MCGGTIVAYSGLFWGLFPPTFNLGWHINSFWCFSQASPLPPSVSSSATQVFTALSRCYARAWRRAEPRGSWTKEKGRRNRTSEWSLAQEEKEWTRGIWRPNAQQDILEPKTDYKMVAALAAPNDYSKPKTLIRRKETLNLKIGNPHNGALPLIL